MIQLWDVLTHENIATIEGNGGSVYSVAFSPDGTLLASGSDDRTVKLWDVSTHENIATIEGHSDSVNSVSFSPDGKLLASGSDDRTVKLWDVSTHENVAPLEGYRASVHSVSFSPDGTLLASGSLDRTVKLWDVSTHENITTIYGHGWGVHSVSFSPDGKLLASGSSDNTVKLWNITKWTSTLEIISGNNQEGIIGTTLPNPLVVEVRDRNDNPVPNVKVTFVPIKVRIDSLTLSGGQLSEGTDVVEVTTDEKGRAEQSLTLGPHVGTNPVRVYIGNSVVTFETTGVLPYQLEIVSGDNQEGQVGTALAESLIVELRDWKGNLLPDTQVTFKVSEGNALLNGESKTIGVTTDINGRAALTLVLGYTRKNKVEVSIGPERVEFLAIGNSPLHSDTFFIKQDGVFFHSDFTALSPDWTLLAFRSYFKKVKLWNVETKENIATLEGHNGDVNSVSFSPDGGLLATGSSDDSVKLWDVSTHENIATLSGHRRGVNSVSFSPDGGFLATGSRDQTVKLWDVSTHENIATLEGHRDLVRSVVFSQDGALLASGSDDGTVKLWDVSTHTNIATLEGHRDLVRSVVFSQDGALLASGSDDGTVKLWDVKTHENIATLEGDTLRDVNSVSFSQDSALLASGSYADIKLWDVSTHENIATLEGHRGDVNLVVFSQDGALLASGSDDGTVLFWNMEEIMEKYRKPRPTSLVKISGDSQHGVFYVPLPNPLVVEVRDQYNNPLPGAKVKFAVTRGNAKLRGQSAVETVITDTHGKASIPLTLGDTIENYIVAFLVSEPSIIGLEFVENASVSSSVLFSVGLFSPTSSESLKGDVNGDGVVNIQDLVLVASNYGQTGENVADINGDGIVHIIDMIIVAAALGTEAAAPTLHIKDLSEINTTDVKKWLSDAQQLNLTDATTQHGILFLEQLLAALIPKQTSLLANFPNPFNPETWIPYHLANASDVKITIYDVHGSVVRHLNLGHQDEGYYMRKSRAAYWDGKNSVGEHVVSGIYFYTFTAGNFTATRKMLIRK